MVTKKRLKKSIRPKLARGKGSLEVHDKVGSVRPLELPKEMFIPSDLLQGKYCNVGVIKHTSREFIFDYLLVVNNQNLLVSRIITNPAHAKELHDALGKNIDRFEHTYGKIQTEEMKGKPK